MANKIHDAAEGLQEKHKKLLQVLAFRAEGLRHTALVTQVSMIENLMFPDGRDLSVGEWLMHRMVSLER